MAAFTNYLKNVLGENKETRQTLRRLKSFHKASEQLLDIIYQYGKVLKLNPGEVLIKEGDFDQWIFLILKGSLSVYIKDQRFDKVSSTLVGERCILGEPRKASLKADDEVFAFGIDMAMTDVLQNEDASTELKEAFNELLVILIEQVLSRVLHLWSMQKIGAKIGIEKLKLSNKQRIIDALANEDFANCPSVIAFIWQYLKESADPPPHLFWNAKTHYFNTRKLLLWYLKQQSYDKIVELSEQLMAWEKKSGVLKLIRPELPPSLDYSEVTAPFKQCLIKHLGDQPVIKYIKLYWDDFFEVDNNSGIDLSALENLLVKNLVPFSTTADIWISFIEQALNLNQQLNNSIYQMNSFLKLPDESSNSDTKIFKVTYQEELELKNLEFLQEHLIDPYLAKLEKKDPKPPVASGINLKEDTAVRKPTTTEDKDSEKPLKDPTNFDELLKQLGATPGVPME